MTEENNNQNTPYLRVFSRVLRAHSIDLSQLRALVRCYFQLSFRGKLSQSFNPNRKAKPQVLVSMAALYLFVGFTFAPLAFKADVFTYSLIVHCMTFLVVGMATVSDAGDVLFNTSENDVLGHRPIAPATLLLAKTLHLIGFTAILGVSLNIAPMFFGLASRGAPPWFPVTHTVSVLLLCAFSSAAVVCVYGLIVRWFDREKFDNIAAWSQVGMSVFFIVGNQFMLRLAPPKGERSLTHFAEWMWPLPPAWFAALDVVGGAQSTSTFWLLALLGLLVTAGLARVAIGKLAPSYSESLARLSETRVRPAPKLRQSSRWLEPLWRWWMRDPIERACFRLAAVYMRRDREIKMRLYPSLAMFVIFPAMSLFDRNSGALAIAPLMAIWFLGMMPATALESLRFSTRPAAADIFSIAPLASAAPIFHGVRKAAIFYLLLPAVALAAGAFLLFLPNRGILWLALPSLIALPSLTLMPALQGDYVPLSRLPVPGRQSTRNMALIFGSMIGNGALVGAAWVAQKFGVLLQFVVVEAVCVIFVHAMLSRIIRNRRMSAAES